MKNRSIRPQVKKQLRVKEDGYIEFYTDLIKTVNSYSPVSSFKICINTSFDKRIIDSNITIITFENLPKDPVLRQTIIDKLYYETNENFEYKFTATQDKLILIFNY